jgi:hypothetical protein
MASRTLGDGAETSGALDRGGTSWFQVEEALPPEAVAQPASTDTRSRAAPHRATRNMDGHLMAALTRTSRSNHANKRGV